MYDMILKGGTCATLAGIIKTDVAIKDGKIAELGDIDVSKAEQVMDVTGLHVLPGVIDSQVHFREPGLEHKEDLATGTAGAALGGVTAVFEMPNTKPSTITAQDMADKCRRAKDRVWTDIAFFIGAAAENAEKLPELERQQGVSGVKIFMGSSTGSLLVKDDATLASVLASGQRRVAVHCEDEDRLEERFALVKDGAPVKMHAQWRDAETAVRATKRLLKIAKGVKRRVHVLHVTTADEMEVLPEYKDIATVECTPQHLTLNDEWYEKIGTKAQMNPPIRAQHHVDALWKAVNQGVVDCIGSDHAPHTLEEKSAPYPQSPSGMTGVQTLVPVMLNHVNEGRLSLERFVDLTSAGPCRIYNVASKGRMAKGYDADFTIVDMNAERTITDKWIASRCGWTPYDGMKVKGWPISTIVRGNVVMHEDQLIGDPQGEAVRFAECL
ncbi:Dihydroorotase multifunctional complex type [Candidatus Terasakiella magnetica]|uniref:Dihydroorotase multifunctional complex type n=1 Tax=Candidatus Terasakiella magnetica TaxID=1867952 RepID=A0A1C3RHY8_9PROT|nr:dihydroorotase [Candidatus Terasakiella magnetica]SCA56899.1 Dihydroorotase multifunctional complex type [Candidatus Terasakiella magnetica]